MGQNSDELGSIKCKASYMGWTEPLCTYVADVKLCIHVSPKQPEDVLSQKLLPVCGCSSI